MNDKIGKKKSAQTHVFSLIIYSINILYLVCYTFY